MEMQDKQNAQNMLLTETLGNGTGRFFIEAHTEIPLLCGSNKLQLLWQLLYYYNIMLHKFYPDEKNKDTVAGF